MIHWSVIIFTFNGILKSSIKFISQNILNYIHRHSQIWMYLHVSVTATGFCLHNRDPICETELLFLNAIKSLLFTLRTIMYTDVYQEESSSFLYPKGTLLLLIGCPLVTKENHDLNSHCFLLNI